MVDPSEAIWHGTQLGEFRTSEALLGWTVSGAEGLQLKVLERYLARGEALGGWKVGFTSGRLRDAFGAGVRPFGFILQSRIFASGTSIDLKDVNRPGIETELCFRLGSRLEGATVDAHDARDAVASVAPAFEINEDRIRGPEDVGLRTADNLRHWGIVVGSEIAPMMGADLMSMRSELKLNDQILAAMAAEGHIDDHFESIAALARELARFGRTLEPGHRVITGSFVQRPVEIGGTYEGSFDGLGSVTAQLSLG